MPQILKVDPRDEGDLARAVATIRAVLDKSGVIAFPTDTFYGLGADPSDEEALSRIFLAKGRPEGKPLLVLVTSTRQARTLAETLPPVADKLIPAFWPGPLTLVFKARESLPERLTAGTGTIGLRQPGNDFTLRLLQALGRPLTATSANPSGQPSPVTAEQAATLLGDGVDLIVDAGPTPGGRESTLLDVTVSPPRLLREGAVSRKRIEDALGFSLAAAGSAA